MKYELLDYVVGLCYQRNTKIHHKLEKQEPLSSDEFMFLAYYLDMLIVFGTQIVRYN